MTRQDIIQSIDYMTTVELLAVFPENWELSRDSGVWAIRYDGTNKLFYNFQLGQRKNPTELIRAFVKDYAANNEHFDPTNITVMSWQEKKA